MHVCTHRPSHRPSNLTGEVVTRCPDLKVWIDISCVIAFFWTASKIGARFVEALESMIAAVSRFRRKMVIFSGPKTEKIGIKPCITGANHKMESNFCSRTKSVRNDKNVTRGM